MKFINKEMKKDIKFLKNQQRYDEIYKKYGSKIYLENTPLKYMLNDYYSLKNEGKGLEIFYKYGQEKKNNKFWEKIKYNDIKDEKGTVSAVLWKTKKILAKMGIMTVTSAIALGSTSAVVFANTMRDYSEDEMEKNTKIYEKDINEYNNKVKKYVREEFAGKEYTHTEIFMKVMEDMWNNIAGYKTPEKDIKGFLELDLLSEDGYGVCRNMSSDVAKKLNAINPDYNARTMSVKMGEGGEYVIANIERNLLETNETTIDNKEIEESNKSIFDKIIPNHMVTLVNLPEKNVMLVLDPTNPGIGVYRNGKIKMFNNIDDKNQLEFSSNEYMDYCMLNDSAGGIVNDYVQSFLCELSNEELVNEFGLQAQNDALKNISVEKNKNTTNSFKEGLKVTISYEKSEKNDMEGNQINNNKEIIDNKEIEMEK